MAEFPCMPDDEVMWKSYSEMTGSFVQGIIVMKDIDLGHIMDSPTLQNSYLKCKEYFPRSRVLSWRASERLNCNHEELLSEIYTWMYWLTRPGTEDYYFVPSSGQMVLYSGFAEGGYDAEQDFDYGDYISMRSGYSHIKRMLLKTKTWPSTVDERSSLPDRMKYILNDALRKIANYIAEFLRENREKTVALRQACEVPTEAEFMAGIKRASTSTPGEDAVDYKKVRKLVKAFNAALPAMNLSCTSKEVEITVEEEPRPCLQTALSLQITLVAIKNALWQPF